MTHFFLVWVENEQKVTPRTALKTVTAGLVIICFILASVIIALIIQCKFISPVTFKAVCRGATITVSSLTAVNGVLSEQRRENINLTAQIGQLWTEKTDLQRQTEELTRERDGLNWTMRVIMEYENFPVKDHCPQKGENIIQFMQKIKVLNSFCLGFRTPVHCSYS